jgi:DNA-binding Lrp family transcriptional regulator
MATHLGNGCANEINRHHNPIWPQLSNDRITASVIADGFHLTGTFDFQSKVHVSDMDEYQDFMLNKTKLSGFDNIGHIESYFVMTEVKNTSSLPI